MKNFYLKFKKWIIAFFIGGAVLAGGLALPEQAQIPDDLKLKCDKSKILKSKEVDWIVQKEDGTMENRGRIIKYDYISDKKAIGNFRFKDGNPYTNVKTIKETKEENIDHFYIGDHFYKNSLGEIFEIEHGATTTIDAFEEQTKLNIVSKIKNLFGKNVFAASGDPIYSGAGDGHVRYYLSTNWDTTHDASTGDVAYYIYETRPFESGIISTTFIIYRMFLPFNTSTLPDDCTINSASLFVKSNSYQVGDDDAQAYAGVVQTSQATTTSLATTDYNNCGATDNPTLGAPTIALNNFSAEALVEFVLNSDGRSWISKTSWTKLGLREGHDIEDVAIVSGRNYGMLYQSEHTGTDRDPYLSVTYSEAVAEEKKANQPQFYFY
ncbi:hypothetical protein KAR28_04360 [Candidatus Parcubacteria bacterium]|nr:hypothetical protein [Candidatus Parcubacteria bacterium]